MSSVIGIAIEAIFFATLGITSINLIAAGNWTGVDATTKLVGTTVASIIIMIAVVLLFLKRAGYTVKL